MVLIGRLLWKRSSNKRNNWKKSRFKQQKGICPICSKKMSFDTNIDDLKPTVDHIIPLSKGGDDHYENVQTVHQKCNFEKGNKLEQETSGRK